MSEQPEQPTPEELQLCLQTLQRLTEGADAVDDNTDAYRVFQAAQKLYKAVKKHRKYMRKQEEPAAPVSDATSVRFQFSPPDTDVAADVTAAIRAKSADATEAKSADAGADDADEVLERDALTPPAKARRGKCYMCRQRPRRFHDIYESMCEACGDLNLQKRLQQTDLSGRVAVLTGGRVKIGFQVGLKLLRSGAEVIVTTRFPHDAARRYAAEDDFADWSSRLQIYGLDLRHLPSVYQLTETLQRRLKRLDILIQNAAQTVRRPPAFYSHLLDFEQLPRESLPAALQSVVADVASEALSGERGLALASADADGQLLSSQALVPTLRATPAGIQTPGLSALLSQVPLVPGDEAPPDALFPAGSYDEDGQQEDHRAENSWTMKIADVPGMELWEVHTINAMAPFLLLQQLTPLLERSEAAHSFVVHVAAAEGQFGVFGRKPARHPHTNMSKAALNMLTRTCAEQYASMGILVNSVDPGWVSYELPLAYVRAHAQQGFQLPLDAVDGAARIMAPIFEGIASGAPQYGILFKDYQPAPW